METGRRRECRGLVRSDCAKRSVHGQERARCSFYFFVFFWQRSFAYCAEAGCRGRHWPAVSDVGDIRRLGCGGVAVAGQRSWWRVLMRRAADLWRCCAAMRRSCSSGTMLDACRLSRPKLAVMAGALDAVDVQKGREPVPSSGVLAADARVARPTEVSSVFIQLYYTAVRVVVWLSPVPAVCLHEPNPTQTPGQHGTAAVTGQCRG